MIDLRCTLTVRSWMPRSPAICLFSRPRRTWPSTSRSRGLMASKRTRRAALLQPLLARLLVARQRPAAPRRGGALLGASSRGSLRRRRASRARSTRCRPARSGTETGSGIWRLAPAPPAGRARRRSGMRRSTMTQPGSSAPRWSRKARRRRIGLDAESAGAQQPRHRQQERRVVIDDVNGGFGHGLGGAESWPAVLAIRGRGGDRHREAETGARPPRCSRPRAGRHGPRRCCARSTGPCRCPAAWC